MNISINNKFNGWWQAFYMACIGFPLYNVGVKYAIDNYGSNPLLYLCYSGIIASLFLLIYSGRGVLVTSTLKTLDTWLYGFLKTISIAFGVSLMVYVTATQGSVLIRFASIFCFVLTIFMGQSTNKKEVFFAFVALLGTAIMFYNLDIETKQKAVAMLLLIGVTFTQALRQLLAEFHKTNVIAVDKKETMRVSGVVAGVTSAAFMLILFILSMYKEYFGLDGLEWLPKLADYFNIYTIICAFLFAGIFEALNKFSEFSAAKLISAKYLSAVLALSPVFVLFYELLLQVLVSHQKMLVSNIDYMCIALVVIGNIGIALSGIRSKTNQRSETELREKYKIVNTEELKQTLKYLQYGMKFYNNDIYKLTKVLKVKQSIIIDILALDGNEEYSLSRLQFNIINRNYYLNIQIKDSLTSLTNRGNLELQIEDLIENKKSFNLVFIDLDKFKQVNDKCGHDIGDQFLIQTGEKMKNSNPFGLNARNGGDEFIMIIFDDLDATIKIFKEEFSKGFNIKNCDIKVGFSYGVVTFPHDANNLDGLIKIADKKMYDSK